MQKRTYTVEELMMDDSFVQYCLDKNCPDREFWDKEIAGAEDQGPIISEAMYMVQLLHGNLGEEEVHFQVGQIIGQIRTTGNTSGLPRAIEPADAQPEKKSFNKWGSNKVKRRTLAGIALLILVFAVYRFTRPTSASAIGKPVPVLAYQTGMGQRLTVTLPDQSTAVLNSNSRIVLQQDFNKTDRRLVLDGAAFFSVAKNPDKPFVVMTPGFSTTAIGTSFYVQARGAENDGKVDLLEGRVKLTGMKAHSDLSAYLLPGEEGRWKDGPSPFTKSPWDTLHFKNWVAGNLSFTNLSVDKVFALLGHWYGVEFVIHHGKWAKLTLTGNYDNKPLEHVLKIVCFSLSASYSFSGNKVIIE